MADNFFKTEGIFRGYVRVNGKGAMDKFKDKNEPLPSFELVEADNFNYAGVLADDIILIDVDNQEQSNKLFNIVEDLDLKCNVLQTTRGKHFYFKNTDVNKCATNINTPIGIKVDIKVGCKNCYGVLKNDGVKREILKEVEKLQELPKFLNPIKHDVDFSEMQEGDGRNQSLFNYILRLQSAGMSKDDIKGTIKIINQYMLKEPLSDTEVETILRDESFLKESFYIKGKLQYKKLAKYMINDDNIVKINHSICLYKDDYYMAGDEEIYKLLLEKYDITTKTPRKEILENIKLLVTPKQCSKAQYICVNNGIYDIEKDELLEHNKSYIITNKIPYNYNPTAYHELTDKTLNNICCNDKQLRAVVEEMIGYILYRSNKFEKSFILLGEGSNGKSTLINMIKTLLGEKNLSSLSLQDLNARFKVYKIEGKLVNLGDDISNQNIDNSSNFKIITSGDTLEVERKGENPYDLKNYYTKLIFATNQMPRINDTSNGLLRKLLIIPFNATFTRQDPDYNPFIINDLTTDEAMEYLLKLAIDGLKRILINNGFTEGEKVKKEIDKYKKDNNTVLSFLDDTDCKIENEATKDIYLRYSTWCNDNNLKPESKTKLTRELKKLNFDVKTTRIDGKIVKIYIALN